MKRQMTNKDILAYALSLQNIFLNSEKEIILPVKVNFYLQKNLKLFTELASEIEESRLQIGEKYGEYNQETESYIIKDKSQIKQAQNEIKELLSLTQNLEIYTVSLEDLQDLQFTTAQMNAMLFMIKEEE